MKAVSHKYALAALKERRAILSGDIRETERKLRHLVESRDHLDAVLRLFSTDLDPDAIPPKKPYKRLRLFNAGELNRIILGVLRVAEKPLGTAEVTAAVCAELGHGPDAVKGMQPRVRANLQYLWKGGRIGKEGEKATARWNIESS